MSVIKNEKKKQVCGGQTKNTAKCAGEMTKWVRACIFKKEFSAISLLKSMTISCLLNVTHLKKIAGGKWGGGLLLFSAWRVKSRS